MLSPVTRTLHGLGRLNRDTHYGPIKNSVPVLSRYSARHNGYRVPCILGLIECRVSYKWTWLHHIASYMVNANDKQQCWMPFCRLLEVDISLCSRWLHFGNKKARWSPVIHEKHKSFKTKRLVYRVRDIYLWYNGATRSIFMCSTIYAIAQSLWNVVNNIFSSVWE